MSLSKTTTYNQELSHRRYTSLSELNKQDPSKGQEQKYRKIAQYASYTGNFCWAGVEAASKAVNYFAPTKFCIGPIPSILSACSMGVGGYSVAYSVADHFSNKANEIEQDRLYKKGDNPTHVGQNKSSCNCSSSFFRYVGYTCNGLQMTFDLVNTGMTLSMYLNDENYCDQGQMNTIREGLVIASGVVLIAAKGARMLANRMEKQTLKNNKEANQSLNEVNDAVNDANRKSSHHISIS